MHKHAHTRTHTEAQVVQQKSTHLLKRKQESNAAENCYSCKLISYLFYHSVDSQCPHIFLMSQLQISELKFEV